MSAPVSTTLLPPVPRTLSADDPRVQTPPSRVGQLVTDPNEPGWVGVVTWDPTYRDPRAWGFSRGLLLSDEGAPCVMRLED